MATTSVARRRRLPPSAQRFRRSSRAAWASAVSSWRLASAVARAGQLGVVSGVALDTVLARRLQDGDPDGDVRRALAAFPGAGDGRRVLTRYFRPGGRPPGTPYTPVPRLALRQSQRGQELAVLGNFVEVWLAKEGHDGLVGINYLEKVQMATPAAAYGAMLAGVDYVLIGAGIPREIPQLLDRLADHAAGAAAGRRRRAPMRRRARRRARPARAARRRPAAAAAPDVPGHRLGAHPRGLPCARRAHPAGRVRGRGPGGRRPQRAAARPAHPRRARPAGVRAARRGRPRQDRRARPAVLAGRLATARPSSSPRRGPRAPRASRSARCSRSVRGLGPGPGAAGRPDVAAARRARWTSAPTRRRRRPASRSRWPSCRARCPTPRCWPPTAAVRPRLPADAVRARRRRCRLPLPGRAGARLPAQGRRRSRTPSAASACATR